MSIDTWLAFAATAAVILVIPGPTIIFVIGQSLAHGPRACLPLVCGVVLGDALCIVLSLAGLSTLLSFFSSAFLLVKYLGAAYLIYLGIAMIRSRAAMDASQTIQASYRPKALFRDIFLINALNPKGIIFYSAFMPQFVSPAAPVLPQFLLLGGTFLSLAVAVVTLYALLAGQMSLVFKSHRSMRIFTLSGGLCMIGAGIWAAAGRQK